MKTHPYVNDTLRDEGLDAVRARSDNARKYNGSTHDEAHKTPPLCVHVSDWVKSFTSPDYVVDGVILRGFLYSLTGRTGAGKTSIAINLSAAIGHPKPGQKFGPHEVASGRVLYIPAENNADVQMRFIGLAHARRINLGAANILIASDAVRLAHDFKSEFARLREELRRHGDITLVIVDTSPSMFPGDDENSNPQMLEHAKRLREFTELQGTPATIALCHPAKNANAPEHLIPRGGGSYIGEVDGNLTAWDYGDKLADLHWCGKFRGPNFEKITFKHELVHSPDLLDSRGRPIPTVVSKIVSDEEVEADERTAINQEDQILKAMANRPHGTIEEWAADCGWHLKDGKANKWTAHRVISRLRENKLVTKEGRDLILTPAGKKQAKRLNASQNDDE